MLLVLCDALFLDALDISMTTVALPSIRTDLGMSTSALQWVVSGYVLGFGGFLLLGGRTADLLGRRRVFLIGIAVFAAASALGAITDDGTLLIATRFVKGVAAAFTAPAGLSIITTTFAEGPVRNKALSIYPPRARRALLASDLSQREIGAELYISLNTVKFHNRNILRKLGVSSRAEAVARGRELVLL